MRLQSAVLFIIFVLTGQSFAQQATDAFAPEAATAIEAPATAPVVAARDWMVIAAHPLASDAGAEILRAGGSAADALVAVQLVLGLVEPQSSGIGGGGFLLHWDSATMQITSLDGRETAPAAAGPDLFIGPDGKPLPFFTAVVGGRSVGTPATLRLMEEAHRRHGRLPWARLFEPAIRLAEQGFRISPRLAELVAGEGERLKHDPATAAYFFDADGRARAAGTLLRNPAYADTLRRVATEGTAAFYGGEIAADIVGKVQGDPANPGLLALSDLSNYAVAERPPVCGRFAGVEVCSMGPPSSGGITVLQILSLVEPYGIDRLGPRSIEAWRLIGDASRLAFADRERWLGDPDRLNVPARGLLAPGYLSLRAKLLGGPRVLEQVQPGTPAFDNGAVAPALGDGRTPELPSTTQVVIRDAAGDVISYTGTIENAFGSRLMVRGFLLNNELTDFSFTATDAQGNAVANRVEGGKRPRSSMAPTIVLRNDRPVLALGSPGGSRIIGFVAQALIANLAWGMDVGQAVSMPHMLNRFGPYELEAGTPATAFADGLKAIGYRVEIQDLNSGLAALAITPDGLLGAADPRREGIAIGE